MEYTKFKKGDLLTIVDKSGVWEKFGEVKSKRVDCVKCVYGHEDLKGTTLNVSWDTPRYLINKTKFVKKDINKHGCVDIRIVSEDNNEILKEIIKPSREILIALSSCDTIRLTAKDGSHSQQFNVAELIYDLDECVFYLSIMAERIVKDEEV